LSKYKGINTTTPTEPKNAWEAYLEEEHEKTEIPKAYITPDSKKTVTQTGLLETSAKNYKQVKPKLSSMFTTGI
jgi:hypothetical protein